VHRRGGAEPAAGVGGTEGEGKVLSWLLMSSHAIFDRPWWRHVEAGGRLQAVPADAVAVSYPRDTQRPAKAALTSPSHRLTYL
jgi:hypothetical protein